MASITGPTLPQNRRRPWREPRGEPSVAWGSGFFAAFLVSFAFLFVFWRFLRACWANIASSRAQIAPRWLNLAPKTDQPSSKTTQRSRKMGQHLGHSPEMGQHPGPISTHSLPPSPCVGRRPAVRRQPLNPGAGPAPVPLPEAFGSNRRL